MSLLFTDPVQTGGIQMSRAKFCADCSYIFDGETCPKCGGRTSQHVSSLIGFAKRLPKWKSVREIWKRAEKRNAEKGGGN
jgi:hypothetical protein